MTWHEREHEGQRIRLSVVLSDGQPAWTRGVAPIGLEAGQPCKKHAMWGTRIVPTDQGSWREGSDARRGAMGSGDKASPLAGTEVPELLPSHLSVIIERHRPAMPEIQRPGNRFSADTVSGTPHALTALPACILLLLRQCDRRTEATRHSHRQCSMRPQHLDGSGQCLEAQASGVLQGWMGSGVEALCDERNHLRERV